MGFKYLAGLASATFVISGVSTPASAAAVLPVLYCKNGPGIDLVNTGCISGGKGYLGGGDGIYDSKGGGDPLTAVQAAILGATGIAPTGLALYGKFEKNSIKITFNNALAGQNSGTWDVVDNSIFIKYITVKAANGFALYEFAGSGANSGSWTTAGMRNGGGNQPGASHISFWTATTVAPVPEPSTWAMMLIGFGFVGGAMRSAKRKQKCAVSLA